MESPQHKSAPQQSANDELIPFDPGFEIPNTDSAIPSGATKGDQKSLSEQTREVLIAALHEVHVAGKSPIAEEWAFVLDSAKEDKGHPFLAELRRLPPEQTVTVDQMIDLAKSHQIDLGAASELHSATGFGQDFAEGAGNDPYLFFADDDDIPNTDAESGPPDLAPPDLELSEGEEIEGLLSASNRKKLISAMHLVRGSGQTPTAGAWVNMLGGEEKSAEHPFYEELCSLDPDEPFLISQMQELAIKHNIDLGSAKSLDDPKPPRAEGQSYGVDAIGGIMLLGYGVIAPFAEAVRGYNQRKIMGAVQEAGRSEKSLRASELAAETEALTNKMKWNPSKNTLEALSSAVEQSAALSGDPSLDANATTSIANALQEVKTQTPEWVSQIQESGESAEEIEEKVEKLKEMTKNIVEALRCLIPGMGGGSPAPG